MGNSSSFPCPYCNCPKSTLQMENKEARTLERLSGYCKRWKDEGAVDKKAKRFFNCIHEPLVCGSPHSKTVLLCPPPALHITLGLVNAIFKRIQVEDVEISQNWVQISNCQRHSNYGFTGRDCHKLLKNRTMLPEEGPTGLLRKVLDQFQDVFKACFQDELLEGYADKVDEFSKSWVEAKLPNLSKFHILKFLVPEFCKETEAALGRFGEQASETVHFDFAMTWAKVKVPETSDKYDEKLLRAVILYNSSHL